MKLEKLVCQCCGGTINRVTMSCEYCGTKYLMKDNTPTIRIETFKNPIREVCTKTIIPDYMINKMSNETFHEHVVKQAVNNLAESIADCVNFDTEYDPGNMSYTVHASLKVVVPKEKSTNFFPWGRW